MIKFVKTFKQKIDRLRGRAELIGSAHLGRETYVGRYSVIQDATIGNFCSISRNVSIGQTDHWMYSVSTHPFINEPNRGGI